MVKKPAQKKSPNLSNRLDTIEQLVRSGFRQVEQRIDILDLDLRDFKSEVNQRFAIVDERFNMLANHIDGFTFTLSF